MPSAVIGLGSAMMIMPGLSTMSNVFAPHVLGGDVRIVGDEVDAVALGRPRLHAVVAEEFARRRACSRRLAGRDLGDDLLVAGQRDLVPELAHHVGRLAERDRRADLRGVAAIAGGQLHVDDVALLEHAARTGADCRTSCAGLAIGVEPMMRKSMSPPPSRMAAPAAARSSYSFTPGLARATIASMAFWQSTPALRTQSSSSSLWIDEQLVQEVLGEHQFGVGQVLAQRVVLIDRHVVAVARVDLHQADAAASRA